MGWGDDLMWLGEAKHLYLKDGKKRKPGINNKHSKYDDPRGPQHWNPSPAWRNSPYVDIDNGELLNEKVNKQRPYHMDKDYIVKPAELTLTESELKVADDELAKGPYWIINPDNKPGQTNGRNKVWSCIEKIGYQNWQKLVDYIKQDRPNIRLLRLKPSKFPTPDLKNVENINSLDIRHSMILPRLASLIITTEGFYHHLAAAWNIPAVVLYGSCTYPFIPPNGKKHAALHYEGQLPIYDKDDPRTPCFSQKPVCSHCVEAWKKITPELVYEQLQTYTIEKNIP
jgi:ADP-heptose:LPS heptosyltransferase